MTSRRMAGLGALLVLVTGCAPTSGFWDRSPRVGGVKRSAARPAPRQAPRRAPRPAPRPAPYEAPAAPPRDQGTTTARSAAAPTQEDYQVLERVNQIRRERGLRPFAWCGTIWRAAYDHSMEQHVHGYMGHGSPDPRRERLAQRMLLAGYDGRQFGEVVAWNYRTVEGVVRGWMNSPSHRSILLDRAMTEAAFSRVGMYWTGNFGLPRPVVQWRQAPPRRRGASAPAPEAKAEPRAWRAAQEWADDGADAAPDAGWGAPVEPEPIWVAPAEPRVGVAPEAPDSRSRTLATPAPDRGRTVRRVSLAEAQPRIVRRNADAAPYRASAPIWTPPPSPAPAPAPRYAAPTPPPASPPAPETAPPPVSPRSAYRAREQGSCYVPPAGSSHPMPRGPSPRGSG